MEKKNLFNTLLGLMEHVEGSNNYDPNTITIRCYSDNIEIQTSCRNEYGSDYANNDNQFISWHSIPRWARTELLAMGSEENIILYREDYE